MPRRPNPADPSPDDSRLIRAMKTRPRESLESRIAAIPPAWRTLHQKAIATWEKTRSGKTMKELGEKALAPMFSTPANSWCFQGVVSMPPKPIANKTDFPMFYLSIGHTAQYAKQISPEEHKLAHHLPTILACVMLGELAVVYHEIEVGTRVIAKGYFQSFPAYRRPRTLSVLGSLEIVPGAGDGESESGDPSAVSQADIQTLLDIQRVA